MTSSPDAVVVTYNSADDLRRQLRCAEFRAAFERVIVVDNGSQDDSVEVARDLGAEVHVLEHNPGFGAAVNFGARLTRGDAFALFNPDVYFEDRAVLDRLMERFAVPSVGLVAPGLVLPDGRVQDSARAVPAPWELVVRRLSGKRLGAVSVNEAQAVDWVVGACMVVRRAAFDAIGGFDESYRLYFEDVDLCVRLWNSGYEVIFEPRVVARHDHRAESRSTLTGRAMRRHLNGARIFYGKHPRLLTGRGRRQLTAG